MNRPADTIDRGTTVSLTDPLAAYRPRLMGIAYRMLGDRADAEDIIQDAYIRYRKVTDIMNMEAFLVTTVTRLCIDHIRRTRSAREHYVGSWLPDPILDEASFSPGTAAELADDLSFALLLVFQKLTAAERAAFILHDIFEYSFARIAPIVGKSEVACRQLASRARKAVRAARPVRPATRGERVQLLERFGEALSTGDVMKIASLLSDDAVLVADGGGIKLTALNPILGPGRIARYFIGVRRKFAVQGQIGSEMAVINSMIGVITRIDGLMDQTMAFELDGGKISAIFIVRNPKKLVGLTR